MSTFSTLGAGADGAAHGLMSRRTERAIFLAGADGAAGVGRCGVSWHPVKWSTPDVYLVVATKAK